MNTAIPPVTPEGERPLRAAVVGLGGMGMGHARLVASLPAYALVAGCDLRPEAARRLGAELPGAVGYTDYPRLLAEARPDVVVISTNSVSHAALTIQAAEAGLRGVYCEKPMATSMADGRAMLAACRRAGTALAVNHQRRLLPVFRTMRRLIDEGVLGGIELIRASCAGDMLSDGTHLIDTVRFLAGDEEVAWVFGQVYRERPDPAATRSEGFTASGGWRYGHPVETGALAVLQFASGLRAEVFTGTMQPKGRRYQDYEVFGTDGRLRRAGDKADPPLMMQRETDPGWTPVALEQGDEDALKHSLLRFAETITSGLAHPLAGEVALVGLEVVMAIYESARRRERIAPPLDQPRFPLAVLVERGEL